MTRVYLEWPPGVQEYIVGELERVGISASQAEMAVDIVASCLVVEIGSGRIKVEKVNRDD